MDLTVHLSPESLRRLDYFARNWGYSRSEAVSILFHPSPLIGMDPGVLTEMDPPDRMTGWRISFPSREFLPGFPSRSFQAGINPAGGGGAQAWLAGAAS